MSAVSTSRISPTITTFGILSQNVTQTFGERQIDLRFHIDLRDTGQSIFHRFLDRDDAPLHRIDAAEEAIKRRRFSAPGRTGEKDDPVGLRQQMPNNFLLLFAEIETIKSELLFARG